GDWFLALELVEGCTAADLLETTGPLPPKEALCIAERVARALAYAHERTDEAGAPLHLVHRDVKPANVLLSRRGDVKLTDFGIARATGRITRTKTGTVKGSLPYLAPEQARGDAVDGRTDLFSLGCTLQRLLTGAHLIDGGEMQILAALAHGRIPPPPASLPASLRALLASLTAYDPADRPASALEVANQLRAMMLPEQPEDIEPMIGALVRHVVEPDSKRPPKPLPEPTGPPAPRNLAMAVAVAAPATAAPGAAAPSTRLPDPAEATSAKNPPGAMFKSPLHLFAVATMGLIVVWVGVAIFFHPGETAPRAVTSSPTRALSRPSPQVRGDGGETANGEEPWVGAARLRDASGDCRDALEISNTERLRHPTESAVFWTFHFATRCSAPDVPRLAAEYLQRYPDGEHAAAVRAWQQQHPHGR
ncbi:MAG TPA: serine/threonine-protein kinase, partial [bacterium]|nr:serine/threonine-protein kinase [bacterium]